VMLYSKRETRFMTLDFKGGFLKMMKRKHLRNTTEGEESDLYIYQDELVSMSRIVPGGGVGNN
jgi:hypothetical protein